MDWDPNLNGRPGVKERCGGAGLTQWTRLVLVRSSTGWYKIKGPVLLFRVAETGWITVPADITPHLVKGLVSRAGSRV